MHALGLRARDDPRLPVVTRVVRSLAAAFWAALIFLAINFLRFVSHYLYENSLVCLTFFVKFAHYAALL